MNQVRNPIVRVFIYVVLVCGGVVFLMPFYWMFISAFKSLGEFFSPQPSLWPTTMTLGNYYQLFSETEFVRWFVNSAIVSIGTVVVGLAICGLGGFALAKYSFAGKSAIFWVIIASVAIPEIVTIIPVFQLMVRAGLVGSYWALILPYSMNVFGIFLMRQYISSAIPDELLDAARIDGTSEFGLFWRIVVPLSRPGLGVLAIFLWLKSWSSYFWPLIMMRSREMLTVPVGLATLYADPWNLQYGMLMAGAVLSTAPIILVFLVMQEQFISGLTQGSFR